MIHVIIATCNRPGMLRESLRSVAAQTICNRIGVVTVSENGGNAESRLVCAEFRELPIEYIFRDPPLPLSEHGRVLFTRDVGCDFTAILHDDDWWEPSHLVNGIGALEANRNASVYFSSFMIGSVETGLLASAHWHIHWWIGANYPKLEPIWKLDLSEVAAAAFVCTPGHYSAMIARHSALIPAIEEVVSTGNIHDTDRMLAFLLAKHGPVLYRPFPDTFIRTHPGQDSNIDEDQQVEFMSRTTDWLVAECVKEGIDLYGLIAKRLESYPSNSAHLVRSYLGLPWCTAHGRRLIALNPALAKRAPAAWRHSECVSKLRDTIRNFLPPLAYKIGNFIRNNF